MNCVRHDLAVGTEPFSNDYAFKGAEAPLVVWSFMLFNAGIMTAAVAWVFAWKPVFFVSGASAAISAMCFRYVKFRVDQRSLTEAHPSPDTSRGADIAIANAAWLKVGRERVPRFDLLARLTILVVVGALIVAWRRFGS
jgi:hypothetical protein